MQLEEGPDSEGGRGRVCVTVWGVSEERRGPFERLAKGMPKSMGEPAGSGHPHAAAHSMAVTQWSVRAIQIPENIFPCCGPIR